MNKPTKYGLIGIGATIYMIGIYGSLMAGWKAHEFYLTLGSYSCSVITVNQANRVGEVLATQITQTKMIDGRCHSIDELLQ